VESQTYSNLLFATAKARSYCKKYEEMALGKSVSAYYELPQVEVDQGWLLRN